MYINLVKRNLVICRAHLREPLPQSLAPTCLRWPAVSPCCTVALLVTRSRTQRLVLNHVSTHSCHTERFKRTFYNRIDRATLLAEATVDALCHIDIVARRPPAAIHTFLSLDCDSLRRADGFAELASNAALFASGIPSQSVFTSEAGRDGALLERIEDGIALQASDHVLSNRRSV